MNIKSKSTKTVGLPPGTMVHIGKRKKGKTKIEIMDFDKDRFEEKKAAGIEDCFSFRDSPSCTWINIAGLHELDIIEKLGVNFKLHPLILEDIVNTEQRPKSEMYGDYVFVVLKMLSYDEQKKNIKSEQVSLVIGPRYVLSFQEEEGDIFDPVRERIRTGKGRIRTMGPDYLAYSIIDAVVDHYFLIIDKLYDRISAVEDELISDPKPKSLQEIYELKRHVLTLRRSIWPLREAINNLNRVNSPFLSETFSVYLRDVYDHTIHVIDTIETYRDIITGMLDTYMSSVSNKMNEVMKVLTIIATIFIPLTFIAGIYGMNFKFMPELQWKGGYFIILGIMAVVFFLMLIFFRRKKWL
ncbi:MAG: magnesium/cobalt transporter CorA [Candidatus Aminicenantes bacterium]|nr:magnesium/cobalt transporter CorA [Candidatus Aminicenantes bacterium]